MNYIVLLSRIGGGVGQVASPAFFVDGWIGIGIGIEFDCGLGGTACVAEFLLGEGGRDFVGGNGNCGDRAG